MDDVIRQMSGPELIGLVAVVLGIGGGVTVALAGIVVPVWMWTRRTEARAVLARDLVSAGYPAEDIVRVVEAAAGSQPACERGRAC